MRPQKSWRDSDKRHSSYTTLDLRKGKTWRHVKIWLIGLLSNKKFWMFLGGFIVFSVIAFSIMVFILSRNLPDPNRLIDRQVVESTKIYDRTGENLLYEISGGVKRTLVNLNEIPSYLKQATISVEDKDYYKHGGISYWAIFRTVVTNFLFGKKAGGSTLTQQFVKNSVLTNEKSYVRKIKEAILAVELEKTFTKDEILQMYFNEIPYGSTAYGVEAASQLYFNKHVQQISLSEAAVLAALPQAPSYYSPFGPNREALIGRQHYILDLMNKYGYITKEEATAAKAAKLVFREPDSNITAPHFVMYVKELLAEKYGEKAVEQDGLKIITTLDLYKQKVAEETITKYGETNAQKYQANNAALLSIDPKTGQILAMVGSRDYFNEKIDGQVNITTSLRQPGSSLKPFVYATAFIRGYTPNTTLYDVVTNFSTNPAQPYEPHNYTGKEYGPVSMRKALAGSLNIPAVKTLYLAGVNNVLDLAGELGYTTLNDRDRFGLSIVLGGGEVKMLEHVNAYSVFAREGKILPVSAILKVIDRKGNVLEEFSQSNEKRVFDANIGRMVNDILSDNNARSFIFGASNLLTLGTRPVAVKTGTTNDYRDAWTIGYTPSLVTGVWVGNNDNSEMKRGSAAAVIAVPIWHDYMKTVLGDTPIEYFKKPDIPITGKAILDGTNVGETKIKIDKNTGLLATDNTPADQIEEKIYKDAHCILYYVNKNDPRGAAPTNPADDPQFPLWESRVRAWAEKQGWASSTPPTQTDNVHLPENKPTLNIISPKDNETISKQTLTTTLELSAPRGIKKVDYYIDGNLLATVSTFPFNLDKQIDFLASGFHELKIVACDDVNNCTEDKRNFNLAINSNLVNDSFGISWASTAFSTLTYANKDFPLTFKFNLQNTRNILKVELYSIDQDEKSVLVATLPKDNDQIIFNWTSVPPSGKYWLYAKAYGWNDKTAETVRPFIYIKNTQPTATTTAQ